MKSSKKNIRVLIADDHEIIRQGFKKILSETDDMTVIGEANNGNEVIKFIKKTDVDVVVLDFDMPHKNGLDTLIELKTLKPKLPVLILSIFSEEHYGTRFLKAGASGYMGKASASDQLVLAVRKVASGGTYISPALTDKLVAGLNNNFDKALHESLTDREFQVFRMLAEGKKLTDIAEELFLSVNTISTYRTRILDKMEMENNASIIHYAIKNGLIN
jgi:two-component system, NarL family, invasion response regulator UvrY